MERSNREAGPIWTWVQTVPTVDRSTLRLGDIVSRHESLAALQPYLDLHHTYGLQLSPSGLVSTIR